MMDIAMVQTIIINLRDDNNNENTNVQGLIINQDVSMG